MYAHHHIVERLAQEHRDQLICEAEKQRRAATAVTATKRARGFAAPMRHVRAFRWSAAN